MPHQYLANVYVLLGRLAKAAVHLRRAVELAPDVTLYRRNLTALEARLAKQEPGT